MNILNLITNKDRLDYSENLSYATNYKVDSLFSRSKTDNFKVEVARLVEGHELPVMALIHELDVETHIGERANYKKLEVEKMLIKEELNTTERLAYFLKGEKDEEKIVSFIFDDMGNIASRVMNRVALMENQLLSTGHIAINENNFVRDIDFGYKSSHNIALSDWSDPEHSIVADLNRVITAADAAGKTITRALTSKKVVSYLVNNKEIQGYFTNSGKVLTQKLALQWVYDNFGIAFDVEEKVYKMSPLDTTTHRMFPENKIAFFGGEGHIGKTLFVDTPEDLLLDETSSVGLVTFVQWEKKDPAGVFTKGSAVAIPVLADIDNLFIATVSA